MLAADFGDTSDLTAEVGSGDYQTLLMSADVSNSTVPSTGRVDRFSKIASDIGGGPTLVDDAQFGQAMTSLGDLDGDGVSDLAVSAVGDGLGGGFESTLRGAVHVLLMNADGTVKSSNKIASDTGGGPTLTRFDLFGNSLSALGDLNGDGVPDLAVGALNDNTDESTSGGVVHVLLMNADGTVKSRSKIGSDVGGGPTLPAGDFFASSMTSLGDLDGDGVSDLAVGAMHDETGGDRRGAVHVLLMNADGTVKSSSKIASDTGGGPTLADFDSFGVTVAALGDLDGDGVTDLAVGAEGDGSDRRGVVYLLRLNPDGTVKSNSKIASDMDGPTLAEDESFGRSLAPLGDLDGDGVPDLALVTTGTEISRDAVHLLLLNADGTVKSTSKIAGNTLDGPTIASGDQFGSGLASLGDLDGDGVIDLAVGAGRDDTGGFYRGAVHILFLSPQLFIDSEFDFGDAIDALPGTGRGNYQTTLSDNGPRHRIVDSQTSLFLGASVDRDRGELQNARANADDGAHSEGDKDEDGILSPADLVDTAGTAPSITLLATNTTESAATLNGWIDVNADGVFDNTSERAQVDVPSGSINGRFTLTFPGLPIGSTGTTYARFRLSTDAAAADSIGPASDGEVEDYVFSIMAPGTGRVDRFSKIASDTGGGPMLVDGGGFGDAMTSLGDLDGDGVVDLAVGVDDDAAGGFDRGAVHVLLMNVNGTVKSSSKIASDVGGGPTLNVGDFFGSSLTSPGDLDGDGITDLAVLGGNAVHLLLMNADGTAKRSSSIAGATIAPPAEEFGSPGRLTSLTSLGDLDGNGVNDLAAAASGDSTEGDLRGAVYVLLMNADGTLKRSSKIASDTGGGPTLADYDFFGRSLSSLGDFDGDGVVDLAVGAVGDGTDSTNRGAVYVLMMNADGTVKRSSKIASDTGGGPTLADFDSFGSAITSLGDLDGDGVVDLAVGADADGTGGVFRGAVYVLLMNSDGTVKSSSEIASDTGGGPTLADGDRFGSALATIGDLDGDHVTELVVGASRDDTGGNDRGALHVLFLEKVGQTAPTVVVDIVDATLSVGDNTSEVTFTFSEVTTDFDSGDVTVVGGTLSAIVGSGTRYTATFTADDDFSGTGTVTVTAGSYTGAAGTAGEQGADSVTIDTLQTVKPPDTLVVVDGQIVVRSGSDDLLSVPVDSASLLEVSGDESDNVITLDYSGGNVIPPGGLKVDGGGGLDTLRVTGGLADLDFTSGGNIAAADFSELDSSDPAAQSVTLDASAVAVLAPTGRLLMRGGGGDKLQFTDPDDWRMGQPITENGFRRTVVNDSGGEPLTVEVDLPFAWQNLANPYNANNDEDVSAGDAIIIINELTDRVFSMVGVGTILADPAVAARGFYLDVNGDGYIRASDALAIINYLNDRPTPAPSDGERVAVDADWLEREPATDQAMRDEDYLRSLY